MSGWKGFERIAPRGDGFDREPFDEWYARVHNEIPHVPAEVAEDWIHRCWGYSAYEDLPLEDIRFGRETWPATAFASVQFSPEWGLNAPEFDILSQPDHYSGRLGKYMLEHGTWPVAPVVLRQVDTRIECRGQQLGELHVLEGHLRITYLLWLIRRNRARPTHDVWVATLK